MKAGLRNARGAAALSSLIVLLSLVISAGYSDSASAYRGLFCGSRLVVRDYLAPLDRMLPIQEPPVSGKIPFGPKGMNLAASGERLIVNKGSVGFALSDDAFNHRRQLDWIVETELMEVTGGGRVISSLGVKRRRVGWVDVNDIRDFLHQISGGPAYYRVDIRFSRRGTGHVLGTYSTYARVVAPRAALRMEIETPSVLPGEYARASLANLGTVPIEFPAWDYGFRVWALTGDTLLPVPPNPPRHLRMLLRRTYVLPAGVETRGCVRYLVPTDRRLACLVSPCHGGRTTTRPCSPPGSR
jgi:hypothetical protein